VNRNATEREAGQVDRQIDAGRRRPGKAEKSQGLHAGAGGLGSPILIYLTAAESVKSI